MPTSKTFWKVWGLHCPGAIASIYCRQFRDLMASAKLSYTMPRRNTLVPSSFLIWSGGGGVQNYLKEELAKAATICITIDIWSSGDMRSFIGMTAHYIIDNKLHNPANTRNSPNAVSMLAHRLRRWANIETASGECLMFARKAMLACKRFCGFHTADTIYNMYQEICSIFTLSGRVLYTCSNRQCLYSNMY